MKTIFLSIGFNEAGGAGFAPVDKLVMQFCLNSIFEQAVTHGHKVVIRDHPAITALAHAHMEQVKPGMVAVPEDMGAEEIARTQKPDIVFYLGGDEEMVAEHEAFSRAGAIRAVPLLGTGGATGVIEKSLKDADRAALDNGKGADIHGFERIARVLYMPRPAL